MDYQAQKAAEDARKSVIIERLPEIAKLLGNDVTITDINTEHRLSAVIWVDGVPIHLRYDGYGNAEKLAVGSYFYVDHRTLINDYRAYDNRNKGYDINITDKKSDAQIANDIKRRLLTEDYKADYTHAFQKYTEYEIRKAEKETTVRAICNLLGETYDEGGNFRDTVKSRRHRVTVVVAHADSMTIELPAMTYARTLEVLKFLGCVENNV